MRLLASAICSSARSETSLPVGSAPVTVPVFWTLPRSRSACVRVCVPVHVSLAPGARSTLRSLRRLTRQHQPRIGDLDAPHRHVAVVDRRQRVGDHVARGPDAIGPGIQHTLLLQRQVRRLRERDLLVGTTRDLAAVGVRARDRGRVLHAATVDIALGQGARAGALQRAPGPGRPAEHRPATPAPDRRSPRHARSRCRR